MSTTDSYERVAAERRRPGACFDEWTAKDPIFRPDALIGLAEADGSDAEEEDEDEDEEEERAAAGEDEMPCPFCGEEFDALGLYCHLDGEHHAEAKAGVCPVCSDTVGINLVPHISSEHPSFIKDKWRNRRSSYESHSSTLALWKKDLRERNRQQLYGGSSRATSVSTVPDPLLSSFVGHFVEVDLPKDAPQELSDETNVGNDSLEQKAEESVEEPLLPEVKEERTRRSHFVQGLVLSLIFDDIL